MGNYFLDIQYKHNLLSLFMCLSVEEELNEPAGQLGWFTSRPGILRILLVPYMAPPPPPREVRASAYDCGKTKKNTEV